MSDVRMILMAFLRFLTQIFIIVSYWKILFNDNELKGWIFYLTFIISFFL
jgi:hypothetical protein